MWPPILWKDVAMSYSMDSLVAKKNVVKYEPHQLVVARTMVFQVQCRMCGFEPENTLHPPRICPKCHSQSWERYARPGSILQNADRFQQ